MMASCRNHQQSPISIAVVIGVVGIEPITAVAKEATTVKAATVEAAS